MFDKNVPIPHTYVTAKKYYFEKMELNDSILVDRKDRAAISSALQRAQKKTGYKFLTRTTEGGTRVWRTL